MVTFFSDIFETLLIGEVVNSQIGRYTLPPLKNPVEPNTKVTSASILLLIGYENGARVICLWVAPCLFLKTRVSPNCIHSVVLEIKFVLL